jgi:predicted aldo/keto reductase-like oxidoreductase
MIEKIPFGQTGHISTRILFGAAALWDVTPEESERTLNLLFEYGINHIDTAASYGKAEVTLGPWLERHRQEFFLATKSDKRTYQEAREELHRSLERMRTDHIDLWQMHCLIDEEGWETAMGSGGALEAFIEAREQELVCFLGVTAHDLIAPAILKRSLERFDFDSVLLVYNYPMMQNPQYAADFEALYKLCQERNVAMQTIKSLCRGPWGDKPQTRGCWYEPLEEQADIDRAVHYVLSRPGLFLNSLGDINILPRVLNAASRFQEAGPSDEEMQVMAENLEMAPLFA